MGRLATKRMAVAASLLVSVAATSASALTAAWVAAPSSFFFMMRMDGAEPHMASRPRVIVHIVAIEYLYGCRARAGVADQGILKEPGAMDGRALKKSGTTTKTKTER
jgi:hypothetical protein